MVFFLALFFMRNLSGWRKQGVFGFSVALLLLLAVDIVRQIIGAQDLYDAINHFMLLDLAFVVFLLISIYYEMHCMKKSEIGTLFKAAIPLLIFSCLELVNGYIQFAKASVCLGFGMISFVLLEGILVFRRLQRSLEAEKRVALMEKELTQSHITNMISQIQPHFLYNALVGIQELCEENPPKAYAALEHFSHYLRGNLDSLSEEGLISFEKERTHVEDYLNLERMRYEDRLRVIWEVYNQTFQIKSEKDIGTEVTIRLPQGGGEN